MLRSNGALLCCGGAGGYDSFGSCLHWGPYFALDSYPLTCESYTLKKGDFNQGFHTFGLYWDEVSATDEFTMGQECMKPSHNSFPPAPHPQHLVIPHLFSAASPPLPPPPPVPQNELYTYLDTDDNRILSVKFDKDFWARGNFDTQAPGIANPWKGMANVAPFDQQFYLIFNVAVGAFLRLA